MHGRFGFGGGGELSRSGRDRGELALGLVPGDQARIDVGRASHGGGVAEPAGHVLDAGGDDPLAGPVGGGGLGPGQQQRHQHGGVPGPELLGREVRPGPVGDVTADVVGVQRAPGAVLLPGEQLLQVVGGLGQRPHGGQDGPVADGDLPPLALLGHVVEPDPGPAHGHVPLLQRGRAVVVVQLGVPFPADAEQAQVEQAHGAGRHPVPVQVPAAHVPQGRLAQPGQRQREPEHVRELLLVPVLAPPVVVAVLGPVPAIDPGGLDVAERVGRDPHLLPRGRQDQGADPLERFRRGDRRAGRIPVGEAVRGLLPGDARPARITAMQPGHGGLVRALRRRRDGRRRRAGAGHRSAPLGGYGPPWPTVPCRP